jgi:hypothetical protein
MPRSIPVEIEDSLDQQESDAALLYFLTITHPSLSEPVRAVSSPYGDNVGDHILNSQRYYGIPFRLTLVSDDERASRGQLEVLNYEMRIGHAVLAMKTRCRITIEVYPAADFDAEASGDPLVRNPVGVPERVYRSPHLTLVNVKGQTWVSGEIRHYGPDVSTEPASPMRATEDILPGLFR